MGVRLSHSRVPVFLSQLSLQIPPQDGGQERALAMVERSATNTLGCKAAALALSQPAPHGGTERRMGQKRLQAPKRSPSATGSCRPAVEHSHVVMGGLPLLSSPCLQAPTPLTLLPLTSAGHGPDSAGGYQLEKPC